MSIASENRIRQLQEQVQDLLRRVAELEQALAERKTLRLPKDKP